MRCLTADDIQNCNGYIWHTTASGKTLTSIKTSKIIMDLADVHKVIFVVDRKDLDYQTMNEFNSFKKGCVDVTDNTRSLVRQFTCHAAGQMVVMAQHSDTMMTVLCGHTPGKGDLQILDNIFAKTDGACYGAPQVHEIITVD